MLTHTNYSRTTIFYFHIYIKGVEMRDAFLPLALFHRAGQRSFRVAFCVAILRLGGIQMRNDGKKWGDVGGSWPKCTTFVSKIAVDNDDREQNFDGRRIAGCASTHADAISARPRVHTDR